MTRSMTASASGGKAGRERRGARTSLGGGAPGGGPLALPMRGIHEGMEQPAIYQRLADVGDDDEVAQMRAELADRFGPPPPAVVALLDVVGLRVLSRRLGVERLEAGGGRALVTFAPSTPGPPERSLGVVGRRGRGV